ncbi:PIR Superfamily Protein [Plasmodium ovale wallikeri]|uniref:PIR Superfamily Protein n=1 Tax=Plasmodium ovale wallikeri TaxID=864142 RepID=A0A1A9AT86_PLAOA|nr:PIR Superfamily Protein [Plasmodium ovale wallikeri]
MGCINGSGKENYTFLRNSHYYGNLIPGFETKTIDPERERVCGMFSDDAGLSESSSAKEMCKEFMYMYNYLNRINKSVKEDNTLTEEDCHFMNYWLNVNLKKNNIDASICANIFYEKLKSMSKSVFSSPTKLEEHLHVIDPSNLENMEILYELYNTKQKIIDIMFDLDNKEDKKDLCKNYTKICYDKYMEGMNKCLYGYDNFYKVLKLFERDYKSLIEEVDDKSGKCKSNDLFRLPENDVVLEAKQRRIMRINISSSPLILLFVIPLLYRFTPFGPFLRKKINTVKNRWMNADEYESEFLSLPTDIEDNISDNGEYNIGYYSETN